MAEPDSMRSHYVELLETLPGPHELDTIQGLPLNLKRQLHGTPVDLKIRIEAWIRWQPTTSAMLGTVKAWGLEQKWGLGA